VNEAPVFTSGTAFTFDENATSAITTIATTDEDTDSVVTYQITGGTDGARFAVNTTTGVLTFSGFIPDFENPLFSDDNDYEVTVTASDGTNTTDQTITVSVNDLNDNAPVFTSGTAFTFDENATSAITTIATTDEDTDSVVTYQITGGTDGARFAVNTTTGVLTFSGFIPDFENPLFSDDNDYEVTVTASDGTNTTDQTITVSVNDLNDNAPVFISNAAVSIVENTKGPTLLVTTDADTNPTVTYSLSGADAADFEIVNNTLALKEAADFETKTAYALTVTANDGVNSTTQAVTYTITDANDNRPIITSQNVFTVDENQLSVGTVTITDADGGSDDPDWKAFFIRGGADKDSFEIGLKTGVITFKIAPDYEARSEYNFQVNVSDGTLPETTQQVKVVIKDVDEAPVFNQTGQIGLNEGTINVGQISASDPEGEDLTFELTGSNDIEISETGYLKFITAPDFETKSEYTAIIIATDPAGNATELDTVFTIRDVNEAPVFTSIATFSY